MNRPVPRSATSLVLSTLVLAGTALAACGGDDSGAVPGATGAPVPVVTDAPESVVALSDLTDPYGCGFGFQAGNPEQTAALFITSSAGFGEPPPMETIDLATDGAWTARLDLGADLFANWCDDVIEMGEPEPRVDETLQVVEGTVEVTLGASGTAASARATGLVARDADGVEYALGDITIVNPAWGMFAG
jgi:hypothetical protein